MCKILDEDEGREERGPGGASDCSCILKRTGVNQQGGGYGNGEVIEGGTYE